MPSLILNIHFIKWESKIAHPLDSVWDDFDWEPPVITTTLCSTANVKSLTYISIKSCNYPRDISLPWNCASVFNSRVASTRIEQKPTTTGLFIYKHSTHTKLRHLGRGRSEEKLSNSWGNKRKSWNHLPSSFHLINTKNKKGKTLDSPSVLISFIYTRNKKKNLSTK